MMSGGLRRALTRALVLGLATAGSFTGPAHAAVTDAGATTTPATTAYDLIDSVGVNVHMHFSDTAYADSDHVLSLLRTLGVRHVRDGLAGNRPDEVAALTKLGQAGISPLLHLSGTMSLTGPVVNASQVAELRELAPYVSGVEPTNELDCRRASWVSPLRTYVRSLDKALAGHASTASLPLLAPSFCRPESVARYGSAAPADRANAHTYAAGKAPELAAAARLPRFSTIQGAHLPQIVTESGYTNLGTAGYPYAASEAAAADYVVRTLLEHKRLGVARTYLYELLDQKPDTARTDPEQHFGLVRHDGSPKPAFTAVRNLLTGIARGEADTVTPATRAQAPYATTVTGGGSLVRSLTISDPGGRGQTVALWLAAPADTAATSVRLQVGARVTATATRPSRDNVTRALGTGSSFDLPVDGAVTLVHLDAPTSTEAPTCTPGTTFPALARQYGASVTDALNPAGWSGAPTAATGVPSWLAGGTRIGAAGQRRTVPVPGAPATWTIGVWARTDVASADYAAFLHAVGVQGASLTTYDLGKDIPSHAQIGAYAPPTAGATWGREMVGQAVPGTWHFLALTSGPGGSTFSVDGIPSGAVSSAPAMLTAVELGAITDGFRGSLSNLAVFPSVLDTARLQALATTAHRIC